MGDRLNIALVGNPNSGKSSLFNVLTGLHQQTGNFPGVTVDKKIGTAQLSAKHKINIIDLPGTYSLYPKREDEWVAYNVLMMQDEMVVPDIVLLVADASSLKRNLLFCSQIIDLKIPVVIALTMTDIAANKGIQIDQAGLERELGVPIVAVNPRKGKGITALKKALEQRIETLDKLPIADFIDLDKIAGKHIDNVKHSIHSFSNYGVLQHLINHEHLKLNAETSIAVNKEYEEEGFNATRTQAEEIMERYHRIKSVMSHTVVEADPLKKAIRTEKLDDILLHRFWGYAILIAVMLLLFQSVFWVAQFPMDAIEWSFTQFSSWLTQVLPGGWFSDLFVNGIIAGLSGIVIFVPQIMILFGLITLLEDTGYMARISFLTDKLMRKVGLNGKSVMPMISGFACAVPAIMSARNIENKKERLLTIMVTPLMSCSARLPVYIILTSLIIPSKLIFGFISIQGLVLMALYLLGTVLALIVAWVMKFFIKSTEKSYFILELPTYRSPRWKNALQTMIQKAKIFVLEAGKVIMIISLLLWGLSSYGPGGKMKLAKEKYDVLLASPNADSAQIIKLQKTEMLENSYAGHLGKAIEPAIKPLGYDWKIGIALITSFAAREVFVGTMATLYSVGDSDDLNNSTLREKMAAATWPDGRKIYTLAAGLSLLIFYVIAMQCMSTLAIVKRETRSWKWPIIQLIYLTILAYVFAWITFVIFR